MPDVRLAPTRMPPVPGEVIDRAKPLSFTWNGTAFSGFDGDTIVSALVASGVGVLGRSFKYHRPRGVLTADYHDPNCIMQVGAETNVRAAHRRLAEGMVVSTQNTWPSLRFDVKAANQLIRPFLGPGFYYKTFMRPRSMWPLYQSVLRRFGGGGVVADRAEELTFDKRYAHPDVLVAGGGPAGMAAALAAASAGARVMLVEEEYDLGGHLRWGGEAERDALGELRAAVGKSDIEVLTDSVVVGRYDHNWIAVVQRSHPSVDERLIKARAGVLVVAAGLIERPHVFAGNDLPGVMLSTCVRRLLNLYAVRPGVRAVVFTANADGDAAASDLADAGVDVAAIVDARNGERIVGAFGRNRVKMVEVKSGKRVNADLLVTATGWTAPTALLDMAGVRPVYDQASVRFVPSDLPLDVMATGGIVGDGSLDEIVAHGTAIGAEAARRSARTAAGRAAVTPGARILSPPSEGPIVPPPLHLAPHPELFASTTDGFVDFSEDVTSKDLRAAVAEGYDTLELAKRYTTATMGPIQGKLEVINTAAIHAAAIGKDPGSVGTTTWRPPCAPVSLGALAGRRFEPVRHSPMQPYHQARGASPMVAGQWIRPDHYGDPVAEVRAVRNGVGIIDVTPLGKLDLRGEDVTRLLDLVYVNRWSNLEIGSVRYGIMCADDGVVLDDGVTGRLAEDRYLMTTTSSGAAAIHDWLEEWLQTVHPEWDVRITPLTEAYASINVAGPHSRLVMQRLVSDIDLDPGAFPFMRVRTGTVAGVLDCIVWRIGFTGELSYEMHVPAGYGLYVWDTLLEVGADVEIAPFGIEAQRIMRLEKGHFIVGQDTDGLTGGFSTGLGALIKLDKPEFVGKPELTWRADDPGVRLVGLQPVDPHVVPPEGSQIVDGAHIIGRITSSRMSPTIDRSICLGLVGTDAALSGNVVTVRLPHGGFVPATVMAHHAHFDVEGSRLRA